MGWPILFRQPRLGRYGETIYVHKFRTMSEERDADGTLLPDAQRLGSVGRMLRRLSLDELPQLWDVFRGAISFVGPRPLLVRYKDRYSPEQWRRHNVFQGITGWAQVNGRNAISWEEKFNLDVWYVDHWSLWLDMKILLRTVGKVARRQGISRPGHETAPEFEGARSGVKEVISSEELPRYSDISQS
jgi:lipopolysaccharide/colanic/teichoic acid biosynthesis glycosyltransferase